MAWGRQPAVTEMDGANAAVGTDDPQTVEADYVRQSVGNRLSARTVPVRPHRDEDTGKETGVGAAIAIGVGVGWDGASNRRTGHHNRRTHTGRRHADVIRYYRELGPVNGDAVAPDGNLYIYLGTCATDKVWELRNVLVCNGDPWTAGAAGALAAVASGRLTHTLNMVDIAAPGVAIPTNLLFSHDQQLVFGGQQLYVVVHSPGANPQLYFASATVREWDADVYRTLER